MPEKITFHQIRKEYADQGIDESSLPQDPMALFQQWYAIAEENQPSEWVEANAMSLATAGKDGRVSNRYVLLKGCLLYTSPSPRDATLSRMPSSA